jgi:hypothetical protein
MLVSACAPRVAHGAESAAALPFVLGARLEYVFSLDEQPDPYPWNAATHAASDRSRVMIDLKALGTRYGSAYVKGAARWTMVGEDDVRKRFSFEQGDYLWEQRLNRWGYALRLFANERRFFIHDWTPPLLDDDRAGATGENRGFRADAVVDDKIHFTGLFSLLGGETGESRSASYVRALYQHHLASLSASYLFEDPGSHGIRKRAVFKTELASAYKSFFAAASYQQSGLRDEEWFFPGGSFDWGAYDGSNFAEMLPAGGAAFAEARLSSLPLSARGEIDIVWRYDAVREEFGDLIGSAGPSRTAHTVGTYFAAKDVSLNGSVLYRRRDRSVLEDERGEWLDARLWAATAAGAEGFVRCGIGKIRDEMVFDTKTNFVHGALRYRTKRFHTGAHAAWSDAGTIFSAMRYAWEGKLVINPAWGFHWRTLLGRDYAVGQTAAFRIEYRPSNRIFAYIGYGYPYLGDDPFVLEDRQLGLLRGGVARYTLVVRGDF